MCHSTIENLPRGRAGLLSDETKEVRCLVPSETAALVAVIASERRKSASAVLRAAIHAGLRQLQGEA